MSRRKQSTIIAYILTVYINIKIKNKINTTQLTRKIENATEHQKKKPPTQQHAIIVPAIIPKLKTHYWIYSRIALLETQLRPDKESISWRHIGGKSRQTQDTEIEA